MEDVQSLETCLVFFYEVVHQVWPRSRQRRGSGKQRFYACTSLETGSIRAMRGKNTGWSGGGGENA